MDMLCLILFLSVATLWFFTNEYDALFGVYTPTCAMSSRVFNWLVFTVLILSLLYGGAGTVGESVQGMMGHAHLDCKDVFLILLSSLIVLVVLKFLSVRGSIAYALLGGLAAYSLVTGAGFFFKPLFLLSFLAAPLMAFAVSAGVRAAFRFMLSKIQVHMMKMSHYMRQAVIICIVLTIFALGINWGGLLYGVGDMIAAGSTVGAAVISVTGMVMLLFMQFSRTSEDEPSGTFADFSIYAVVSVGFAVAFVLVFFSFEATASLVGLTPVPLSASSLVFAAVAGSEAAQKSRLVDNGEYIKEGVAFIAVPLCSFVLTAVFLYMVGDDAADPMVDFVVIVAAILILLAIVFAGYVRRQRARNESMDRLVYTQQQQIYEHSRALNDMELKVVLSENQALHNAVEMKRQEVMNVALSIVEQKEFLESLDDMAERMAKTDDMKEKDRLISELRLALKQRLSFDSDVDSQYFHAQAESLHEDFNAKLSENFPKLTQQERRLATLLRLGFSSKYIATLMNITPKSVEISRYRLRQKLGLSKGDNLVNFIKSI